MTSHNVYPVGYGSSQGVRAAAFGLLAVQEERITRRQFEMVLASLTALNVTIGELLSVRQACIEVGLHGADNKIDGVVSELDAVHRMCAELLARALTRLKQKSQGRAQ